ncbi:MAG TPA: hypothetical protein PKO03_05180 [Anaerolineaceae bacterium]|nr:hypothetical protein [Anaerolineaceae bacterium]
MKTKLVFLAIILVLAVSLTGCGKTAVPTDAPAAQVTEAPAATPVPNGPALGDPIRNEAGGYAFRPIPDYSIETDGAAVMLLAPDGSLDRGPAIMLMGSNGEFLNGLTAADVLTQFVGEMPFDMGAVEALSLQGVGGTTAELTGKSESQGLLGRAAVLMPTSDQALLMIGVAPADRWEALAPYFEAVLNSIAFFEPNAAAGQTPVEAGELSLPTGYEEYLAIELLSPVQDVITRLGEPTQTLSGHPYREYMLQSTIYRFQYADATIEVIANPGGQVVYKALKSIPEGRLPTTDQQAQVQPGMTLSEVEGALGEGYLFTAYVSAQDTSKQYAVYAWPGSTGEGQFAVMLLGDSVIKTLLDVPGIEPAADNDTTHPRVAQLLTPPTNSYESVVMANPDYVKFVNLPLGSTLDEIKAVFGEPARETVSPDGAAIKYITYIYNSATAGEFGFKIKQADPNGLLLQDKDGQLIHKYASYLKEDSDMRTRHVLQVKKDLTLEEIARIMGGEGRIYEEKYDDTGVIITTYFWFGTQYSTGVSALFREGEMTAYQINSSAQDDRYELDTMYEDYVLILPKW